MEEVITMKKIYTLPVKFNEKEIKEYDLCISKRDTLFKNILRIAVPIFILLLMSISFLFLCVCYNFFGHDYSSILNSTIVREYGISKIFVIMFLIIIILGFIVIGIIDLISNRIYPVKIKQKIIKCLLNRSNNKIKLIVLEKRKILDSEIIDLLSLKKNIDISNNIIVINKEDYVIGLNKNEIGKKNTITDVSKLESVIDRFFRKLKTENVK